MIKFKWKKQPSISQTYLGIKTIANLPIVKNEMKLESEEYIKRLDTLIGQGKGVDNQEIRAGGYAKGYIEAIKAGRVIGHDGTKKTSTSPIDLKITGTLRKSKTFKIISNKIQFFFKGNHKGAKMSNQDLMLKLHKMGFKHWHSFGTVDIKLFLERLNKAIQEQLKAKRFFK